MACQGTVRHCAVRLGKAGMEWLGAELYRPARWGLVRQVRHGTVGLRAARCGEARQVGYGPVRPGKVGFSKAGVVRRGSVCHDPVR